VPYGRVIAALMQRLLDIGGTPEFTLGTPNIGASIADVLDKDLEIQRLAPAGLNAAAEAASADHDATTRVWLEGTLADGDRYYRRAAAASASVWTVASVVVT
jgi:bacterioferritin